MGLENLLKLRAHATTDFKALSALWRTMEMAGTTECSGVLGVRRHEVDHVLAFVLELRLNRASPPANHAGCARSLVIALHQVDFPLPLSPQSEYLRAVD